MGKKNAQKKTLTGGGKSSTSDEAKLEIARVWAQNLSYEALVSDFARYNMDPKGWKKYQVQALLEEAQRRLDLFSSYFSDSGKILIDPPRTLRATVDQLKEIHWLYIDRINYPPSDNQASQVSSI